VQFQKPNNKLAKQVVPIYEIQNSPWVLGGDNADAILRAAEIENYK